MTIINKYLSVILSATSHVNNRLVLDIPPILFLVLKKKVLDINVQLYKHDSILLKIFWERNSLLHLKH